MIKRLICKVLGHRRGKRVSATHVRCRRCGEQWARKVKNAARQI